jgi:predicted regulator of Ras-like GTPase activity (Roadblock/LC7/MglB family)
MVVGRLDKITKRIRALQTEPVGISGVALIRGDGTAVVSALPSDLHEEEMAAVMAAFAHLCQQGSTRLGFGTMKESFVKGQNGYLVATPCTGNLILTARIIDNARLGLALRQIRSAASDLAGLMAS